VSEVEAAIRALRAGGLAVIPTDTVYGLAADGASEPAARALYAAKGRNSSQPTAVLFASVECLLGDLPELPEDTVSVVRALLPGALTLVLPNPGRRFGWLNETRPDAVGVRVPAVTGPGAAVLDALGALVATSANLPGGPDPRRLEDVPAELRTAASAVVDGGELAGAPSTVVDLTGEAPLVLREGAVPTAEALTRIRVARG
jgi:L-threonylcarbamoyladenylate synthase